MTGATCERPPVRHQEDKLPMQLQFSTSPLFGDPRLPVRFWAKVKVMPSGCWEWQASLGSNGYGQFWNGQRLVYAHRFAHEILIGSTPVGLESDHLCRHRACVNPSHIEPVTSSVNSQRSPFMGRKGEAHGSAKLKPKDIFAIHALKGKLRQAEIARKFGVSQSSISLILGGKRWTHVTG